MKGEPALYILEDEDGTRTEPMYVKEVVEKFGCTANSLRQAVYKGSKLMKRFYVFQEPDEEFIEKWRTLTSRILEAK